MNSETFEAGIPVSTTLSSEMAAADIYPQQVNNKSRLLFISLLAALIAIFVSFIAKLLVYLINGVTNLAFFWTFSVAYRSPTENHLGPFVILLPVLGGLVVGLMALYGSKAIRGHGIPEAMEQVLTNQSRIKPVITLLKPISAAISIGTGGPFGAEGPIIATGGAFGSTIGQLTRITHHERKILLAAGATAGMTAIFGSPVAGIFLAIELLLFEFSPRAIIPVAVACITGAAGHHLLFEPGPVFAMQPVGVLSNTALATYSGLGLLIGLIAVAFTKGVYYIEDSFEKLPIHWAWWPALGGFGVGIIGYFAPRTLGVGYENIAQLLAGTLPLKVVLALCLLKYLSWAVALGSGTSGGTLAPLLTIGGATGAALGSIILYFFPQSGIVLPLAALVGMSAMFAGASRAMLTAVVFSVETTAQPHVLLPLLAACTGAYFVSFFLMQNTLMTEKIARRGVRTPDSYEPDVLEKVSVGQVLKPGGLTLSADNTVREVRVWLEQDPARIQPYFIVVNNAGQYQGIVSFAELYSGRHGLDEPVAVYITEKRAQVLTTDPLSRAVSVMAHSKVDVLPVMAQATGQVVMGVLSYKNIISAYQDRLNEDTDPNANISFHFSTINIMLRGRAFLKVIRPRK